MSFMHSFVWGKRTKILSCSVELTNKAVSNKPQRKTIVLMSPIFSQLSDQCGLQTIENFTGKRLTTLLSQLHLQCTTVVQKKCTNQKKTALNMLYFGIITRSAVVECQTCCLFNNCTNHGKFK